MKNKMECNNLVLYNKYLEICRLCMSKENVNVDIFDKNIVQTINLLLPTAVAENDLMPKFICDSCSSTVAMISDFRKTICETDTFFQKQFNEKDYGSVPILPYDKSGKCPKNFLSLENTPLIENNLKNTQNIIQNLSQIDGLCVRKVTDINNRNKGSEHIKFPDDTYVLSRLHSNNKVPSEVVIKKIKKNEEDYSSNILYLPENDEDHFLNEDNYFYEKDINSNDTDDDSVIEFEPKTKMMQSHTNKKEFITYKKNCKQLIKKDESQLIEIKAKSMYMCMYCNSRFTCYDKLKEHMQSNDACKNAKLTCKTCGKVLKDRKAMYQHSLSHKEKPKFICEECGKTYTNIFSMENHKAIMHGDKEELIGSVYKCKICSATFSKRKDLFMHVGNHTKEQVHLCDTCGKCFSTEDNLRSHIRTHSEIKPFVCETCAKQFRTKLALMQHSHRHSGIKPFICDICGKTFSKKSSLTGHVKLHTAEEMSFRCDNCLEEFSSSAKLKIHMRYHQN